MYVLLCSRYLHDSQPLVGTFSHSCVLISRISSVTFPSADVSSLLGTRVILLDTMDACQFMGCRTTAETKVKQRARPPIPSFSLERARTDTYSCHGLVLCLDTQMPAVCILLLFPSSEGFVLDCHRPEVLLE